MPPLRCAQCGSWNADLQLTVEAQGAAPETSAVCGGCAERLERATLGPLGALAPHALLARLCADAEEPTFRCPVCGYDVEDLARHGKLGCQRCYLTFEEEVRNLVRRAIGRELHRGKTPPLPLTPPSA